MHLDAWVWAGKGARALRAQQRLDRAALVHCAVALRHMIERQRQAEDLLGINLRLPDQID